MNEFEYYLAEGKVKRQRHDLELAKSLLNDSLERFEKMTKLEVKDFSKIIFENIYDALRAILDALLAADGYKSYSHEASIAYLQKYGVEDSVLVELDDLRYKRNSSKYYGKDVSYGDALMIIDFYKKHSKKLLDIVRSKLI